MYKIIVYPEKCTGCRLCESICALYNERVNDLSRSRIRILKKHSLGLSTPLVCLQCKNPPCVKGCPVNAITKDSDGVVKIDGELCIGCEVCVSECPFGIIIALAGKVIKCELCHGDPQCVKYCMTEAIHYGDLDRITQQKRNRVMDLLLEKEEI